MSEPLSLYSYLYQSCQDSVCDSLDQHVLTSIFTIAAAECSKSRSLADGLGIGGSELRLHIEKLFPDSLPLLSSLNLELNGTATEEEECLRELLLRSRSSSVAFHSLLVFLVARRAMHPNHLWQDLGLRNRSELTALMLRHFTPLALRNKQDMKWKKFFYRIICREDDFRMCTAPCCAECDDFQKCFGEETGESLLAKIRLQLDNASADLTTMIES